MKRLDYPRAISAVEEAFEDVASAQAENFPFLRKSLERGQIFWGIKSACNFRTRLLGYKSGGHWKDNDPAVLDRHQSTILLSDLNTGQAIALLAANNLTAIRTAAASAVAVKHLAHPDAGHLAILGTGRQALFQVEAIRHVRPLRAVTAWSPNAAHVAAFGEKVARAGLVFNAASSADEALKDAQIIVTVTSSTGPIIHAGAVRPGVHISAMGSDAPGKQELDPLILCKAKLFVDDVEQALEVGECQHLLPQQKEEVRSKGATLGSLLTGRVEGRQNSSQITIFDGTGMAVQDLAAASVVIEGQGVTTA